MTFFHKPKVGNSPKSCPTSTNLSFYLFEKDGQFFTYPYIFPGCLDVYARPSHEALHNPTSYMTPTNFHLL